MFIFTNFDENIQLLGLPLWHLFNYVELTKAVGQSNKLVIDLLT